MMLETLDLSWQRLEKLFRAIIDKSLSTNQKNIYCRVVFSKQLIGTLRCSKGNDNFLNFSTIPRNRDLEILDGKFFWKSRKIDSSNFWKVLAAAHFF